MNYETLAKHNQRNSFAITVFFLLLNRTDRKNRTDCSQEYLQSKMQASRSTIYRAIKYLISHNLIEIIKIGNRNIYKVNFKDWSKKITDHLNDEITLSKTEKKSNRKQGFKSYQETVSDASTVVVALRIAD